MTDLVPINVDRRKILQTLNLHEDDPKTQALLLVCQKFDLDPLLKHAEIIKGNTYITRDGYLHIAHKSGVFDGMQVVEETETASAYIVKVAVWRKDMKYPFMATGRGNKRKGPQSDGPDPGDMALARAERRALRRAFNVAGVGTGDIDNDNEIDYSSAGSPSLTSAEAPPEAGRVLTTTPGASKSTPASTSDGNPGGDSVVSGGDAGSSPVPDTVAGANSHEGEETGEILGADDFTVIALRNGLRKMPVEYQKRAVERLSDEDIEAKHIKHGGLLASKAPKADAIFDQLQAELKANYDENRVSALAAMTEIGVREDDARHEFVREATGGVTESTKELTDELLDMVRERCKEYAALDEGTEVAGGEPF